jgi:hypothetical protein
MTISGSARMSDARRPHLGSRIHDMAAFGEERRER